MANANFDSLPSADLLSSIAADLPAKELLADMKGGPLVAMYRRLFRRLKVEPRGVIHLGGTSGRSS